MGEKEIEVVDTACPFNFSLESWETNRICLAVAEESKREAFIKVKGLEKNIEGVFFKGSEGVFRCDERGPLCLQAKACLPSQGMPWGHAELLWTERAVETWLGILWA